MTFKLVLSGVAFILTFVISIFSSNIVFTSLKRSLLAFVIFYIFSSIIEKLLEHEMKLFSETEGSNLKNSDNPTVQNDESIDSNKENSNDDIEFQTIDYDKIDNAKTETGDIDIDNMDPKMIASILRNMEDDKK